MGITVVWDNAEKTVIRADIKGNWGISDLNLAIKRGLDMIESLEHDVDVIVNALEGETPPLNLVPLIQQAIITPTPYRFHLFVVGGHLVTRVAVETLDQVHHFENKATFVATVEEARKLIAERRKRKTRV